MNPWLSMPSGAMRWPHLQRLAARWWRRLAPALFGCLLGLLLLLTAQPEVRHQHAQAEQAVARLAQQWAALTVAEVKPPQQALASDLQRRLASLPAVTRQGKIWTDWQQVLATHGLRLQSLRPVATALADWPKSSSGGGDPRFKLTHQAAAMRVQGRFEDWTRAWMACTETGPLCTVDRISVVALPQAAEVQIDVVMRIWMRPSEGEATVGANPRDEGAGEQALQTAWMVPSPGAARPRSGPALFTADAASGGASTGVATRAQEGAQATGAAATDPSDTAAAQKDLPPDPRHWPLARVRWVGLWQQGGDRQAILSAGTHWVKVSRGQRVTQEGHRVVAIHEGGVSLRLAQEPVIQLEGMGPAAEGLSMGSEKR